MLIFGVIFFIIIYISIVVILLELYIITTTDRISNFLILSKGNKIQQCISLKSALKQSMGLNFYGNKPQNVEKILDREFKDFEEFTCNTKYEILYTSTNPLMERRLKYLAKNGFIALKKINNTPKYKRQFLERLILMGLRTSLYNLFNIKYWKYIFKKVKVNKFEIIIKKDI